MKKAGKKLPHKDIRSAPRRMSLGVFEIAPKQVHPDPGAAGQALASVQSCHFQFRGLHFWEKSMLAICRTRFAP
jgi:hypothetical protein